MWRPSWRSSLSSIMSLRASIVSHVPAISPARAANVHGLSFTLNHELNFWRLWVSFMHQDPLPEATQLTTVLIKFVLPLSGLPLAACTTTYFLNNGRLMFTWQARLQVIVGQQGVRWVQVRAWHDRSYIAWISLLGHGLTVNLAHACPCLNHSSPPGRIWAACL